MAPDEDAADMRFMRRAIALAAERLGGTGANPAVGCVLVRDGVVVAEAATGQGGRPHAEELALEAADGMAHGGVAYVTLEPCGERSNGAAACADRLAGAGIARVVMACTDPSPKAAGRGVGRLRKASVAVEQGLLLAEAAPLYAAYRKGFPEGMR